MKNSIFLEILGAVVFLSFVGKNLIGNVDSYFLIMGQSGALIAGGPVPDNPKEEHNKPVPKNGDKNANYNHAHDEHHRNATDNKNLPSASEMRRYMDELREKVVSATKIVASRAYCKALKDRGYFSQDTDCETWEAQEDSASLHMERKKPKPNPTTENEEEEEEEEEEVEPFNLKEEKISEEIQPEKKKVSKVSKLLKKHNHDDESESESASYED